MSEATTSDFLGSLRRAVSNVHLYPKGHPQSDVALDMLTETTGAMAAGYDQVVLSMMDNAFYLDRHLLPQASLEYRDIYRLLHGRGLDSISIVGRPTIGDLAELADFLADEGSDIPADGTIRLNERPYNRSELLKQASMSEIRRSYTASLDFLTGVAESMAEEDGADITDAVWTVEQLLEQVLLQPGSSLLLSTLKTHDEYTFYHSINTCLLALTVGQAIGLTNEQLIELGVGSLLHDLGKIRVPIEVIQYPGRLDDAMWAEIRRHPHEGAQAILAGSGRGQEVAALVALEHHARYDLTGYPAVARRERLHLYSRITAICDVYDALTTRRAYKRAMPPASALKIVIQGAAEGQLDPDLVQVFVSILGIFPAGSLLRLDTGEVAVVVAAGHDGDAMQAAIAVGTDGERIAHPEPFELSVNRVTDLVLPDEVGLDPASLVESAHLDHN
ncbi:MAG: HD-GYP domain-containing protein [Acidimicrobiia bacterium]|nr:HD-GYP domain-containing protein [Acidimicrobiia bacterium]